MGMFDKKMESQRPRSAYGRALDELRDLGFEAPEKPEGAMPVLPQDLGDLSDLRLMELYNEFVQWQNYAGFMLTRADVKEEEAEGAVRLAESKYVVLNVERGERGIQRANRERDLDPEVDRLRQVLAERRALRKMMTNMFENIERSTKILSRDLTRRTDGAKTQGRTQWTAP